MRTLRRYVISRAGTTLVELIVAAAIMSVGILGLFGAFRFITRSIFVSRGQTLATNLAQERVEYLKNINYYALLVTTASAVDNNFTPGLDYDTVSYPPENITIAGITFTRYTYVSMVQMDNDLIDEVVSNYPDTGMKQLNVHVVWMDNGVRKKWSLRNLLENPYVNPLDATITGTVSKAGGGTVAGAIVNVEQNPDWNAQADASGNFSFRVYHGTYSVRASSAGYYDAVSTAAVVAKSGTKAYGLTLSAIATGTVSGIAWYNNDLVISQVVAASYTFVADGNEATVEYVELFNPTTFPIQIGDTTDFTYPKRVSILYNGENASQYRYLLYCTGGQPCTNAVTVSTFVPSKSYYLIANSSYIHINGRWLNADLYYYNAAYPDYPDFVPDADAGGVALYRFYNNFSFTDIMAWADNGDAGPLSWWEGTPIPDDINVNDGIGTPAGKQVVRVSSPGINPALMDVYGRAYDSGSSNRDWSYSFSDVSPPFVNAYNVASGTFPVLTGKPAPGAYVSASDTNSGSTQTLTLYVTSGALNLPYAPFTLRGVSTGTWDIALAYTTFSQQVSSVIVTQNAITSIPTSYSTPTYVSTGMYHVQLTSSTGLGYVRGQVTTVTGTPLANIKVEGGGNSKLTASNGLYFMSTASGTFNLIANPNNLNSAYVQSVQAVTVSSMSITTQDYALSLGGRIQGYATSGTTPLSNIVFTALLGGSQVGTGTTDASGVFNIRNVSTGTYTVQPVLEVGQDTNPNNPTAVLTTTGTVFVATFTISGSFGNIGGTVTDASGLVTSGALLVASTAAISATPPMVVGSSAPAMTPYYMVSSRADGTYIMPVRGANTYYLSVYVPVIAGASVSITTKTYSNVFVTPSLTTTKNVTIP